MSADSPLLFGLHVDDEDMSDFDGWAGQEHIIGVIAEWYQIIGLFFWEFESGDDMEYLQSKEI